MASFLIAKNLYKNYFDGKSINEVLKGVNYEFKQGKSYAIRGVSGSGKSTLLHLLGGLDFPTSGNIFFDKLELSTLKDLEKSFILNDKFGFVFQFHYLINELSVLENLEIVGSIKGLSKTNTRIRAEELLVFLGLKDRLNYYPYQLSGGEQQRVSIARALFNRPSFILADEPTGNLDGDNAKKIVELLLISQKEWDLGIIICSHDDYVCERMENRLLLNKGLLQTCKSD
ncbi:ABC transporter ATP-binding protein [Candidatus Babeliales bacterium]|nr:ABC transporter ATP-binding protein [Candidatus Babeliales bacterium]